LGCIQPLTVDPLGPYSTNFLICCLPGRRCSSKSPTSIAVYYARNAEIKASAQGLALAAIVCQTLDEFIAKSTGHEMLVAA
jgi:hypothetical protein